MKDPAISLCTPATRGVWIDLLCAMHELGRSGELRGTTDQIARVARCSTAELAQALGNAAGGLPFSLLIDAQGRIRHRKMGATHFDELAGWAREVTP